MQRLFLFVALVATLTLGCGLIAQADSSSKRHLVYSFTVGITSDQHDTSSAFSSGVSGGKNDGQSSVTVGTGDYSHKGNASDKGEITVDYLGVEADGGLVLTIAETARNGRSAGTATCVVYANTNVVCGTEAPSNPEELAVIRTLAPKFFDPTALDANRHWHFAQDAAGVAIDFTAKPAAIGFVNIESQRTEKSKSGNTTSASASYVYAPARLIPVSLKEYTMIRQETGAGQYTNYVSDVTATLVTDSFANH